MTLRTIIKSYDGSRYIKICLFCETNMKHFFRFDNNKNGIFSPAVLQ